jgi:iron complex outermembrane receptor protein
VTAAQYGHIGVNNLAGYNALSGGNANLRPETADTYTLGAVFQPSFISNLVLSVDAFSIKIKDTISSLPPDIILNNCAFTGDAKLCGLIHRGKSGSLWLTTADYVQANNVNIKQVSTKGIDVGGHYRLDMGVSLGKIDFSLSGTYAKDFLTQPLPGGPSFDCAGFWGSSCDAPMPLWRHVLNSTWSTPWAGFDFTVRWRFIGPSEVDRSSTNPQLNAAFYTATAHIPGYNYIDLSAYAPIVDHFSLRVGVNNVADKNPPLILSGDLSDCPNTSCNDNTWVGTYDTLGRYLFFNVTATF